MQTRITRLFDIQHPLICPGMTHVSDARLVAAVSAAGGLGILAVGHLNEEQTRAEIRKVRSLTDKPFGVGVALIMPGAERNAMVAVEERVPVVNFSLGKGDRLTEAVHAYGGKVIATVVTCKHAQSAKRMGVDALLVTGHEAAAHGGAVTTLVLLPAIRSSTDLPIIAAGGFATGEGLLAALALGADAIAMGSRFAATSDSPLHANTKQLVLSKSEQDTLYTANFDGMPCRIMDTPAARAATSRPLSLWRAAWSALAAARQMQMPWSELRKSVTAKGLMSTLQLAYFGAATDKIRRAIEEGDHEKGVQLIGQCQGLIRDIPDCASLIKRVLQEADEARIRLQQLT